MNIVIITWHFPPFNEIASGRPYSWAIHAARCGHDVVVITPKKSQQVHGDLTFKVEQHDRMTLVETPSPLQSLRKGKQLSWALKSMSTAKCIGRDADVIVSTSPYGYNHWVGKQAKQANPSALWLADYRDLWHDNYFFSAGRPIRTMITRWIENWVTRKVDVNVTVSNALARRLRHSHPTKPCEVIYNGFPEELNSIDTSVQVPSPNRPFRIVYTGTIYSGFQDPQPLFASLASRDFRRRVEVLFFGRSANMKELHELRRKYSLEDVVHLPSDGLSRQASIEMQRNADLLLHLGWTDKNCDGWLSGKVFEYMVAGVPILSIGSGPDCELAKLLSDTGTGISIASSEVKVRAELELITSNNGRPSWYSPKPTMIEKFSRTHQAKRFLEVISLYRNLPSRP